MKQIEEIIKDILSKGYLMSLATIDEDGPWVSDVIFVPGEFNLYWISEIGTRHSKAIAKNPKVAATVTLSNLGEPNVGIQIEGTTEKVDGEIYKMTVAHCLKRKRTPPKEGKPFLDPEESWYKLTPSKIELIYESKWGFTKQVLKFY